MATGLSVIPAELQVSGRGMAGTTHRNLPVKQASRVGVNPTRQENDNGVHFENESVSSQKGTGTREQGEKCPNYKERDRRKEKETDVDGKVGNSL